MQYIYLLAAFSLNGVANILLKVGSKAGLNLSSYSPVDLVIRNWQFLLGCVLFAANALFYFLALRTFAISIAYPIMVIMSFVIINAYAVTILKESITPAQIMGYFLIASGLFLIVSNAQ